jgi:hypothetical protein
MTRSSIGWRGAAALAGLMMAAAIGPAQSRIVNCVAAVVNTDIITRADVEIADVLGLFETDVDAEPEARRHSILDKLIDRRLVLGQVRDESVPAAALVDAEWAGLLGRPGASVLRGRLAEFGLSDADARLIVEQGLRFRKIIADRFGRSISVTLKEIETYYAETWTTARRREGAAVKPLVEVLDAIEAEIKEAKIEVQTALWIETLREQAEIEIRPNCLK